MELAKLLEGMSTFQKSEQLKDLKSKLEKFDFVKILLEDIGYRHSESLGMPTWDDQVAINDKIRSLFIPKVDAGIRDLTNKIEAL